MRAGRDQNAVDLERHEFVFPTHTFVQILRFSPFGALAAGRAWIYDGPISFIYGEAAEREESTQVKSMIEESNNGIVTIEIREPDDVETFGIY